MSTDDRQAYRLTIANAPFATAHRRNYADWLEARGERAEAGYHRMMARWLDEAKGEYTLFARPGHRAQMAVLWHGLGPDTQVSLQTRIRRWFQDQPWLLFVAVSDFPSFACGFRQFASSPIAHFHQRRDHLQRVVPAWATVNEEYVLTTFARRWEPLEGEGTAAATAQPESRDWGQLSHPVWDVE